MATLSKLDKLTYSIGIIDKVTGPVNKVMAKINQLSQQTAAAQDQMMRGAATAVGGGYALAKSLAVMFQGKVPVPSSRQLLVNCQNI